MSRKSVERKMTKKRLIFFVKPNLPRTSPIECIFLNFEIELPLSFCTELSTWDKWIEIRPIPLGTVFFQCLYNGTSSGLCVLGWDPVQALRARRCFWMCLEGCWMQTGCGSVAPQPVPASQKGQEGAETLCSVIKDWHRSHPWNHPMQNSESALNGQEAKGKKTQSAVSAILKFFFKEYWLEILLQELKKW